MAGRLACVFVVMMLSLLAADGLAPRAQAQPATGSTAESLIDLLAPSVVCGILKKNGIQAAARKFVTRVSGIKNETVLTLIVGGATALCPGVVKKGSKVVAKLLKNRHPTTPLLPSVGFTPRVVPPNAATLFASAIGIDAVYANVYWSAIDYDSKSTSLRYDLQQSIDGLLFVPVMSSTSATAKETLLQSGHTYQFEVRCHDPDGHVSSWVKSDPIHVGIFDNASSYVRYSGEWHLQSRPGAHAGQIAYTLEPGASVTFTFKGSAVAWVTSRYPEAQASALYLDNRFMGSVTPSQSPVANRVVVSSWVWPVRGLHTIRLLAGSPANLSLDAFVVLG